MFHGEDYPQVQTREYDSYVSMQIPYDSLKLVRDMVSSHINTLETTIEGVEHNNKDLEVEYARLKAAEAKGEIHPMVTASGIKHVIQLGEEKIVAYQCKLRFMEDVYNKLTNI